MLSYSHFCKRACLSSLDEGQVRDGYPIANEVLFALEGSVEHTPDSLDLLDVPFGSLGELRPRRARKSATPHDGSVSRDETHRLVEAEPEGLAVVAESRAMEIPFSLDPRSVSSTIGQGSHPK